MKSIEEINSWFPKDASVANLQIDFDRRELQYNLMLVLVDGDVAIREIGSDVQKQITLYFWNVSNLKLEKFGGGLQQFVHLEVSRMRAGHEGNNYFIEEIETDNISFNFSSVDNLTE